MSSTLAHRTQGSLWKNLPEWVFAQLRERWANLARLVFPSVSRNLSCFSKSGRRGPKMTYFINLPSLSSGHLTECSQMFSQGPHSQNNQNIIQTKSSNARQNRGFWGWWGFSLGDVETKLLDREFKKGISAQNLTRTWSESAFCGMHQGTKDQPLGTHPQRCISQ